ARAVILILALCLLSAGLVALVSRAPASLRSAEEGPNATDPSLGAEFTDLQVDRGAAYRRPGYLSVVVGVLLQLVVLLLLARGPMGRLVDALERVPGGWPVRSLLAGAALALILALATLPLSYVRGYVVAHDWGLSTQDVGGWLSDQGRGLLVSAVTLSIAALAFQGVVRWRPGSWWLWGWGAFTLLTLVLTYLYPVIIAPLFFNFTPLPHEGLTREIKAMAAEAGIEVDRVLVADASRRTTSENAYMAGFGATKQVVVYDTLLEAGGESETLLVVAHELGHQRANHVVKNVVLASLALLGSFALLGALGRGTWPWSWAAAEGVGDLRALPLLGAFALSVGFLLLPVENLVSRNFEREADAASAELMNDSETGVRTFRRLAFANLADLDPPPLAVWTLYSHPPIPDRIRFFLERSQDSP
ncbi:MAG: M48 family metallopeptidase, partial [Actinomycetota bacterium]